jgi:hypothetical protein
VREQGEESTGVRGAEGVREQGSGRARGVGEEE